MTAAILLAVPAVAVLGAVLFALAAREIGYRLIRRLSGEPA